MLHATTARPAPSTSMPSSRASGRSIRPAGRSARRTGGGSRGMPRRSSPRSAWTSRPRATVDTPRRFLRALYDATDGYDGDPKLLTAFPTECHGDANCQLAQVVEGPIPFTGLCEHHVLPFAGRAWVAYVAHDQIIGISKLTRLVRVLTRRFGVQERMTHEIADSLEAMLGAHGTAVVLEAQHRCTQMRGVREHEPRTRTTAYRGTYVGDPALRPRVLSLAGVGVAGRCRPLGAARGPADAAVSEPRRPRLPPRPGRSRRCGRPGTPGRRPSAAVLPAELAARIAAASSSRCRATGHDRRQLRSVPDASSLDRRGATGGREISGAFEPTGS